MAARMLGGGDCSCLRHAFVAGILCLDVVGRTQVGFVRRLLVVNRIGPHDAGDVEMHHGVVTGLVDIGPDQRQECTADQKQRIVEEKLDHSGLAVVSHGFAV